MFFGVIALHGHSPKRNAQSKVQPAFFRSRAETSVRIRHSLAIFGPGAYRKHFRVVVLTCHEAHRLGFLLTVHLCKPPGEPAPAFPRGSFVIAC